MVGVYVRIHAKQSPHNSAHSVLERPRERHTYARRQECRERKIGITGGYTDRIREDGLVVEDILGPVHEGVDILGRGKLCGSLVAHAIFPEIFVSGSERPRLSSQGRGGAALTEVPLT
jgi:hypothetical protein